MAQQTNKNEKNGIPMPAPTAGGNPKPTGATAKPGLKKKHKKGSKSEKESEDNK